MPATLLAHLALHTTYCVLISCVMPATLLAHLPFTQHTVFRPPRHWLMVFRTFPTKIVVIFPTGRIVSAISPFQSQTLAVCRNVCNHLPSNVLSYNRRMVRLFVPLWKPKNSRNCVNLSPNWTAHKLLHCNRQCHCTCNFRQCSEQWALSPADR
jgi:hypothetical protein